MAVAKKPKKAKLCRVCVVAAAAADCVLTLGGVRRAVCEECFVAGYKSYTGGAGRRHVSLRTPYDPTRR